MRPVLDVHQSILGQPWRWRGRGPCAPGAGVATGVGDLAAGLFAARGADSADYARLAAPTLRDWLPDPHTLLDMEAAADRLARAVLAAEPVTVFGDYDVDGATSAAVLIRFLRAAGADPAAYIPDRLLEGYGPSPAAMRAIAASGTRLLVTVDCGAQGFEALAHARDAGMDVLVIDHHQCATELPACHALVNPNRLDQDAGLGHLAAVGVTFLLTVATARALRARGHWAARAEPRLLDLLDLVALGTVADVVPLTGLNRAFVTQGLKVLARRGNAGLAALADAAGLSGMPTTRDLGFALGPRVNAGGRIGAADLGVRLLTTACATEAAALAAELHRLNAERRAIESCVQDAALEAASAQADDAVIVVAGEGWHAGVIGIVASRLKEKFGRPAMVIGLDGATGKGSGRSIAGVDLGAAVLAACDEGLLIAGGGHAMAAGLTVAARRVGDLRAYLCDRLGVPIAHARADTALLFDAVLAPGGICPALADAFDAAGPYGAGWPAPRVVAGPGTVVDARPVGENHLRVVLAGADGARLKAVAFRHADSPLGAALMGAHGRRVHLAGRVHRDDWGRAPAAELYVEDAAWAD